MSADLEGAGGTSSPRKQGGKWSKARGHPHHPDPSRSSSAHPSQPKTSLTHPSAPRSSPDHPSPGGVVPKTTLRIALSAPELLAGALSGETWHGWRSLLLAAMGEDLKPEELETFRRLTERQEPPRERVSELVAVVGRRGGKSRAIATLLCYLACLVDYKAKAGHRRGRRCAVHRALPGTSQDRARLCRWHPCSVAHPAPVGQALDLGDNRADESNRHQCAKRELQKIAGANLYCLHCRRGGVLVQRRQLQSGL